jgi:hypothetical protein
MASLNYNSAVDDLAKGNIDFDTDTFYGLLVTSSYVPNKDTHTKRSDVTNEVANGNGYTTGGKSLAVTVTKDTANDRVDITFADPSWPAATFSAAAMVIYKHRGGASTATNWSPTSTSAPRSLRPMARSRSRSPRRCASELTSERRHVRRDCPGRARFDWQEGRHLRAHGRGEHRRTPAHRHRRRCDRGRARSRQEHFTLGQRIWRGCTRTCRGRRRSRWCRCRQPRQGRWDRQERSAHRSRGW